MATDPICGMYVDERLADLTLKRENRTYYFCCGACRDAFADPQRHVGSLRHRLLVAWPLSLAVVGLVYGPKIADAGWIELLLAAIVQGYAGSVFYRGTWDALRSRVANMDVLIAVGTSLAFFVSAAAVVAPSRLPPFDYFDASTLIVTIILTGNYLEQLTRSKTSSALLRLGELLPSTVTVVRDGRRSPIPASELRRGDRLIVAAAERIAADGTVAAGRSTVDESIVTGESRPIARSPGDAVVSGSLNLDGPLEVEVVRAGADAFVAEVGRLIVEAEGSRIPLKRLADRIAERFVPFVLALAALAAAAWLLTGASATTVLLVFVTVTIVACPCAFGIATPAAILAGIGQAADRGVLFRGDDAIERSGAVDLVMTDKTGTLTEPVPTVASVRPSPGRTESEVIARAAGLARSGGHPMSRAVESEAERLGIPPADLHDLHLLPGVGVTGKGTDGDVALLSGSGAASLGIDLGPVASDARAAESDGRSWSVVVEAGRPIGILAFEERLVEGVPEAVAALRKSGVRVAMLTGDHEAAATRIARRAGIEEVHPGLTPAGKLRLLQEAQAAGHRVAYVGDGINDAPALTAADLGIAIGAGTDVAREAGRVVLLRRDFRGVVTALSAGRATLRKVRQNIGWALGYNAVLLPIAAGALVPVWGPGIYSVLPEVGAIAMALSSTTVVLNSYRLKVA